jgi:hypothetical protein
MAQHLATIFGTEKDRVNCPFYFKIGYVYLYVYYCLWPRDFWHLLVQGFLNQEKSLGRLYDGYNRLFAGHVVTEIDVLEYTINPQLVRRFYCIICT